MSLKRWVRVVRPARRAPSTTSDSDRELTTDGKISGNGDRVQEDVPEPREPSLQSIGGLPSRFGRNVSISFLATAVAGLASIVVTPLLLHHLGESAYGVWALALSIAGYLEILELGLGSACTRLIAEDAGKRPEEVSETLSTGFLVLSVAGLITLAVGLGIAFGAPYWFHLAPGLRPVATAVIAIMAFGIAVSVPGDTFGGALAAYQRYDLRSWIDLMMTIVTIGAIFLLVEKGFGLEAVALAGAVISIALHPVRWLMLRSIDPRIRLSYRRVSRNRFAVMARSSKWFLLAGIASVISYSTDLIILGAVLSIKAVALYAIGATLGAIATRVLLLPASVLLPEAASLSKDGSKSDLAELLVDGTRTTMLLGIPISLIMGILAVGAVRAWVGVGYDQAASVLVLFCVYSALRTVLSPLESVIIGAGIVRPWALTMTIQGVVNVALTVVLVLTMGLVGPAVGTVVATALVLGPAFTYYGCRAAHIRVATFLGRVVVPHLLPALLVSAALVGTRDFAERGRIPFAATAVAAMALYGVIYYLWSATPAERDHMRSLVARVHIRRQAK